MTQRLEAKVIFDKSACEKIEKYSGYLERLLCAESVQYSEWSNGHRSRFKSILKQSAGIYHFFRKQSESTIPLYVGKAGFGDSNEWNLYNRISQHFQPSQTNTLLGKIARTKDTTPKQVKLCLDQDKEVYLQWLILYSRPPCIEQELIWVECFCKSILEPKYTTT